MSAYVTPEHAQPQLQQHLELHALAKHAQAAAVELDVAQLECTGPVLEEPASQVSLQTFQIPKVLGKATRKQGSACQSAG